MRFRSRLSQRIILSVVLLTVLVSSFFAIVLTATIHFVEENLVANELQRDFARVFDDYRNGRDLRLDEGSAFFPTGPALPDYLRSIPAGYSEIILDDRVRAYYVYHLVVGENSYFLVKDQTSFERAEVLLHRAVLGGFILCVLVSCVLGVVMVKQVIAPVRKLTQQVADRGTLETLGDPPPSLASAYADDEVGALAAAFDATFTRLQQALSREVLFTSDVSHELRTPLMVIQSACEVLVARQDLDDYSRQRIGSIHRAAKEIQTLVEAFLALARGKDHHLQTATLHAIVKAEFPAWEQMAKQKGNRLLLQEEERDPEQQDREHPTILLRTVIDNLIRNASQHTTGSDIVLVLKTAGFELRDTGSGIAADEVSKVFKPYYRGSASHPEGLGLGLSLVQRICEREHWTVTLEQNRPHGCHFTVDFA